MQLRIGQRPAERVQLLRGDGAVDIQRLQLWEGSRVFGKLQDLGLAADGELLGVYRKFGAVQSDRKRRSLQGICRRSRGLGAAAYHTKRQNKQYRKNAFSPTTHICDFLYAVVFDTPILTQFDAKSNNKARGLP